MFQSLHHQAPYFEQISSFVQKPHKPRHPHQPGQTPDPIPTSKKYRLQLSAISRRKLARSSNHQVQKRDGLA
jgi:hypothetical protein